MDIDQEKLNLFMQKAVGDLGATLHSALIVIEDKLGLYRAVVVLDKSVLKRNDLRCPAAGSGSILILCRKSSVFNRYFLKTTNSALLLNKSHHYVSSRAGITRCCSYD